MMMGMAWWCCCYLHPLTVAQLLYEDDSCGLLNSSRKRKRNRLKCKCSVDAIEIDETARSRSKCTQLLVNASNIDELPKWTDCGNDALVTRDQDIHKEPQANLVCSMSPKKRGYREWSEVSINQSSKSLNLCIMDKNLQLKILIGSLVGRYRADW